MRALLLAAMATVLSLQAQPKAQAFTLSNGLQVLLLEDHEHPLVRALLHVRVEPADLPPGCQGLPLLTLQMFTHSDTADLKVGDLHRLLEDSGLQLSQMAEPDGFEWRLAARSRDQERALGLLADRLLRTVFDPSMLETQRLECWRLMEQSGGSPHARLREALVQGPDAKPTLASLASITWEDLLSFRARVFRPDRAVLVLHGDLGLEQAKRLVLLSLGSWTPQEPPPRREAPPVKTPASVPSPENQPRISSQGAGLRIQALAPKPAALAPETALLLSILIPEDGALFPIRVELDRRCLLATWDPEAGTPAEAALAALLERLETLRRRGFTGIDLDRAQAAWLKGRSLDSLHPEAQMKGALAEARGRAVTLERMKALSLDTLNAGLRSWLDPANLRSGAAGDPEALKRLPKP